MPRMTERARMLRSLNIMKQMEEIEEMYLNVNHGLNLMDDSSESSASESDSDIDIDIDMGMDMDNDDKAAPEDGAKESSTQSDNESFDSDSDSDSDAEIFIPQMTLHCNWGGLHDQLSHLRYFEARDNSQFAQLNRTHTVERWFEQQCVESPEIFRARFRMSRNSFEALLNVIEDHPVFLSPSGSKQTPVRYQLAVFLYCFGSTTSQLICAFATGASEGSVRNYSYRCMTAILSLRNTFITWPTSSEKASIKQRIFTSSKEIFSGCIGFIGGTFITLNYAPLQEWGLFINQETSYALNALLVCDDQRRITYSRVGDISSIPDARVFANSQLHLAPERFFAEGEYIIGDSSYALTEHLVSPFKAPIPSENHNTFNAALNSQHGVIDEVFNLVKARFPSVTNVSIRIDGAESHRAVVNWFETACVLHNFLLDQDDEDWENEDDRNIALMHEEKIRKAKKIIREQEELLPGDDEAGVRLRMALFRLFIESFDENENENENEDEDENENENENEDENENENDNDNDSDML